MGIRWLKMGKISDRMRQDGAKMRKMAHVPSVFTPSGELRHRLTRQHRRAGALGRGWGGVNPPQGLEEIGLEWYGVAQGSYLHALRPKASAD